MSSGVKFKCELKPNHSKRHLLKPKTFRFFPSDHRRTVIISVTSKTHFAEVQKYEEDKNQPISAMGGMAVPCYVNPQKDARAGFQLFFHKVLLHI